ncbi:hypothetical protein Y1Q_0007153 [Alligator mississippiensis]|uniref:Uncharacterized protein n=1 Tax=Alligator mississippiensis TaxID=8496 RepID=A0A151N5T9_ALLMI|nr:hypothetical protein Y1Q_0007153 [Alligator mississippiensis]
MSQSSAGLGRAARGHGAGAGRGAARHGTGEEHRTDRVIAEAVQDGFTLPQVLALRLSWSAGADRMVVVLFS